MANNDRSRRPSEAKGGVPRRAVLYGLGAMASAFSAGYWGRGFLEGRPEEGGQVDFIEYRTSLPPEEAFFTAQEFIARQSEKRLVVVDFFAEWCPPCHDLSPRLKPGAIASGEDVLIVKVVVEGLDGSPTNLERMRELLESGGYPELQIYRNSVLLSVVFGAISQDSIAQFIQQAAVLVREYPELFPAPTPVGPVPGQSL